MGNWKWRLISSTSFICNKKWNKISRDRFMGIINSLITKDGILVNTVDSSIRDVEPCILYGPVMNSLLKFTDFLKKLKENVF